MFHWVEDKKFLGRMKRYCSDLVNRLVQAINNQDDIKVSAYLVGSGARNLITQNGNEPIDLDYNLKIINVFNQKLSYKDIKDYVTELFNEILLENNLKTCQDSTSAITTKKMRLKGNKTEFSIDIGIVKSEGNSWSRLIHKKNGFVQCDEYSWECVGNSHGLDSRVEYLKKNNYWKEVRDCYLEKKNMYLKRNDNNHPSFVVYIESVNEVFYKHKPPYLSLKYL